jgi:hypothetical protein
VGSVSLSESWQIVSVRKPKFNLTKQLDAALVGIADDDFEAMLSEIDDAVGGWSEGQLLLTIFRIEILLGIRNLAGGGRTRGALSKLPYHVAVRDAAENVKRNKTAKKRAAGAFDKDINSEIAASPILTAERDRPDGRDVFAAIKKQIEKPRSIGAE